MANNSLCWETFFFFRQIVSSAKVVIFTTVTHSILLKDTKCLSAADPAAHLLNVRKNYLEKQVWKLGILLPLLSYVSSIF